MTTNPPNDLDIIVLCFNNPDITLRCMSSVVLFRPKGARVIMVDNGSSDPAIAEIGRMFSANNENVEMLRLEHNVGPYAAANAGIRHGTSHKVAIVCNDVVVLPYTFTAMTSLLKIDTPVVGAIQPNPIPKQWDFVDLVSASKRCGLFGDQVFQICGYFTCFVALRALFEDVGLFDERFKLTYGDTDWEERLMERNIPYLCPASAVVYHGHGVTRKRIGIEADVKVDMSDYNLFLEKWKDNPRVMAKNRIVSEAERAEETQHHWDKWGHQ